jgi:DNA glycosylase AlkZ-like
MAAIKRAKNRRTNTNYRKAFTPGHVRVYRAAMAKALSETQVRRLRQDAQLLTRRRKLLAVGVVEHLLGVQAQMFGASHLAIRARTTKATIVDVKGALTHDRSLVWTWAMRGTLHLVTAEDYGWLMPLTVRPFVTHAMDRLGQEGVTSDDAARAMHLMRSALATEGELTRAEIAERLTRRGIRVKGQAIAHLLWLASAKELICRRPFRHGEQSFVLTTDWIGPQRDHDRDGALKELAVRYLRAHGPATPEDLVKWSGMRLGDARAGWNQISHRLLEVRAMNSKMWMLRSQKVEARGGVVRLTPAFEEFLLGWKSRAFSLSKQHASKVTAGGVFRPVIIVDGQVIGTWATKRKSDGIDLICRTFRRVPSAVREALMVEADDVGRFQGINAGLVIE